VTVARQSFFERTPANALREATFRQVRHGYDQDEVRDFLNRMADETQTGDSERASLRAEVAGLREELAAARAQTPQDRSEHQLEISVKAVNLLSQAQLAADNCVAEAEHYARDLVLTAREQYREILQRAQQTASEAVQQLPVAAAHTGDSGGYTEPVAEIEYVRTFARVAQVQLRSVLDALTSEVDKLGQLPRLAEPPALRLAEQQQSPPTTAPAGVSWLPNLPAPPPGY
jgi:DivIVA domain-containing protein